MTSHKTLKEKRESLNLTPAQVMRETEYLNLKSILKFERSGKFLKDSDKTHEELLEDYLLALDLAHERQEKQKEEKETKGLSNFDIAQFLALTSALGGMEPMFRRKRLRRF